jgi:1,4-alpha-glucan branching enzyme
VLGDFNDWEIESNKKMKRDGEYFWITLDNLISGQEYGFQYLVDALRIADPYADKILDPEDQYIPESTYPNLKAYPSKAISSKWYENRVAVFQTNQTEYQWQVQNFSKPEKKNLIVYELLIRDFFGPENRNYQNLIDTIQYIKRLGINAIELMPVMEFNGNEGWGYNPTFMFAPDKYYGTKNKFKEFVDVCHQNGIAVILDIALNHQDIPNPYAAMYFDFGSNFRPLPSNPWFNVTATHPFNVFNDMNHESPYTKAYVDTVNYYWLNEYKVDGFRFDLSKGFTQTNNPNNVNAWSNYDASRVALLKRMADKIWEHTPDAYIILEHLGVNSEEKELAEYRAGEGKGMMLWGKMTDPFNQNTMGYATGSDISWTYHGTRGWNNPGVVGYMESHDEERLMFKNLTFGNTNPNYSVKDSATALYRMRAAHVLFLSIPGPKMIWQFGELGFEYSINTCEDGSVNPPGAEGGEGDCRLSKKPPVWEYQSEGSRVNLFGIISDLIRLRKEYNIFSTSDVTFIGNNLLTKQLTLKNTPYTSTPVDPTQMNLQVAVNFDIIENSVAVNFPHTGLWYDYYNKRLVDVNVVPFNLILGPGEFILFTDVFIENEIITNTLNEQSNENLLLYPNPASDLVFSSSEDALNIVWVNAIGQSVNPKQVGFNSWSVIDLKPGFYYVKIKNRNSITIQKILVSH